MSTLELVALLALLLLGAKFSSSLLQPLKIPSVVVEILVGVLAANLPWPAFHALDHSPLVQGLSEIGVLILLFVVGLETRFEDLRRVGPAAFSAAFLGVVAPVFLAFVTLPWVQPQQNFAHQLFLAAALSATSVGISARVLQERGWLARPSGQVILGAAVIDDVLGIFVLAVVTSLIGTGRLEGLQLLWLLAKISFFSIGVVIFARGLTRAWKKLQPLLARVEGEVPFFLGLLFLSAWLAEKCGLAGIVGAFALGLVLDLESLNRNRLRIETLLKPLQDFLVPIFFVVMGLGVKLSSLASSKALLSAALLILCATLGKFACGLPALWSRRPARLDFWMIAFGMLPRGEVGLIFAAIGLKQGILAPADYGALIAMVLVTTLAAPFLIDARARQLQAA